jgi:hypothetical protein
VAVFTSALRDFREHRGSGGRHGAAGGETKGVA